ncbi:MAG: UDP-N-acetylglucosamine 2-epimerase [Desulfarculaceae bacterium]|nr:UDP-N-acetylglucosamine 2-epimerase [Desulfarculaceae bacterium]MCF8072116.1 UDP-N-acetylglucosamine 2-epimerase [Desulfarculaceae bacterium]MCF8100037.1 UDP-N-acetylglucosamine 2-epimerase [Desulfarculaceae bacterium]
MTKRKIAIFTGNRAEYGLQKPIIQAVSEHPGLEPYLLVGGAHLNEDFGKTKGEIAADGFSVHAEVKIDLPQDDLVGTAQAIGTGVINLSKILAELQPDVLVVYADRFEGFAAVITGSQMGLPVAHIEGGDITEGGALDDMVRHAMTKLAHLHFTTNAAAAERVMKLGEEPWRVHDVGFPAIDLIARGDLATPAELAQRYGLDLDRPVIVFTQHSVTTEFDQAEAQLAPSLKALEALARDGVQVVATFPNNDAGGQRIIAALKQWAATGVPNVQLHNSLGRYNYHGMLALCGREGVGACVGNSSSGIKETPALGCPAVNIGSRQQGRLRAANVIDAPYDAEAIEAACRKALFDESFRALCKQVDNPYGKGDAGAKIARVLATVDLNPKLIQKKMTY